MTNPKIVLITGANKGVGFATARALAEQGHTVLLGARDPGRGTAAGAALAAEGLAARFVQLDVTDEASVTAAAELIEREHGRLDVLVNNAGIARDREYGPTAMPFAAMADVYATNVFGVVAVTNAMLPLLRRSAAGFIGNVSSGMGTVAVLTDPESPLRPYTGLLSYNSSKAALNAVTMIYADLLRADGITVNALSPGFCATDLNNHSGPTDVRVGGQYIAEQVLRAAPTGVFLSETGGTYPW